MERNEEAAFLAGIREDPKDDLRRLVFADWLEERQDDESQAKAEYLRLEVHFSGLADDNPERDGCILKLRELADRIPIEWKTAVAKVPIENCNVRWHFQCPKKWSELEETNSPAVRFCTACRKDVHFCSSVDKAREVAENTGVCVAIDLGVIRRDGDMDMHRNPQESVRARNFPEGFHLGYPEEFDEPSHREPPAWKRFTPPPPPPPGLLRRLWRKLTGK